MVPSEPHAADDVTARRLRLVTLMTVLFLQEAKDIIARADHATVMARRMGSANTRHLRVGIGYCTARRTLSHRRE